MNCSAYHLNLLSQLARVRLVSNTSHPVVTFSSIQYKGSGSADIGVCSCLGWGCGTFFSCEITTFGVSLLNLNFFAMIVKTVVILSFQFKLDRRKVTVYKLLPIIILG